MRAFRDPFGQGAIKLSHPVSNLSGGHNISRGFVSVRNPFLDTNDSRARGFQAEEDTGGMKMNPWLTGTIGIVLGVVGTLGVTWFMNRDTQE